LGFSSFLLVVGDAVVVATAGVLAAYDAATGKTRWIGEKGGFGYSSPHLATIGGVAQIVLLNGVGAVGVSATDGKLLWKHEWKSDGIVQPVVLANGEVLLGSGSGLGVKSGVRCVSVARSDAGWTAEERWTSPALKPYFNDFVVHAGHAYGFDTGKLACIELAAGERKWKGAPRYGCGQLLALAEQGLLLVLSEEGDLALVQAAPERFTELARVPAIKGKTWNHPVLVGDVLLVRNSEEMAAFRLAARRG
jgi:outer membrane protein assembly factor BamB